MKITLATSQDDIMFENENETELKREIINKIRSFIIEHLNVLTSNEFDTFVELHSFEAMIDEIALCHEALSRDYMLMTYSEIAETLNDEFDFFIEFIEDEE